MKNFIFSIIFVLLSLMLYGNRLEYWSENIAVHKISENESFQASYYFYFKEILNSNYFQNLSIFYTNKIYNGIGLYGEIYTEVLNLNNKWNAVNSAVAGIFYEFSLFDFLTIRIFDRFFYNIINPAKWDYHRPRIFFNFKISDCLFSLSDELRLDLTGKRQDVFYKNRMFFSCSKKIWQEISLGLTYILQSDKLINDWGNTNILQTSVKIEF